MDSYFKVESLSAASVVRCGTCEALVPEGARFRHSSWHAELATAISVRQAVLAEANGQHPHDVGELLPDQ